MTLVRDNKEMKEKLDFLLEQLRQKLYNCPDDEFNIIISIPPPEFDFKKGQHVYRKQVCTIVWPLTKPLYIDPKTGYTEEEPVGGYPIRPEITFVPQSKPS